MSNTEKTLTDIGASLGKARGQDILKAAARKRSERESSLFLDIPTWDGDLVAEYQVASPDDLSQMAEAALRRMRQQSNGRKEPAQNDIALILSTCAGLYAIDPDSGERIAIEDESGHVAYDRIAHVLGVDEDSKPSFTPVRSASDAVKYLMADKDEDGSWRVNIVAISQHANRITNWMRDTSKRGFSIEDILGEL